MRAGPVLALLTAALLALSGCAHSTSTAEPAAHRQGPQLHAAPSAAVIWAGLKPSRPGPPYYLSLGDSLAQGIQPGPTGADAPTSAGYPDVLEARLRAGLPNLRLVKLGCSGETTMTMLHGGICRYQAGSQLAEATKFLRSHRGHVALVTIDIGANDPNSCVLGQPVSRMFSCLSGRITTTERNIDTIMSRLRSAAGPRVVIVGMTYYVPELALWRKGQDGKQLALLTEGFAAGVNQVLTTRYHHYRARVANVFAAFKSADFSVPPGQRARKATVIPPNVRTICALTWMCAPRPVGPNEHANAAGYRVIAGAFWQAITG
jgi:lysophospholipase L1-like esterase